MSLLELQNIHKSFAGVPALRGVSLDVRAGETHALVGANGAGKSTLIKVLAGVEWADAGEILLGNRLVRFRSPGEALQAGIRVIHQEFHLAPELSVAENLLLGQEPIRRWAGFLPILDRKALREQARKLLDELGFTLDATQPVKELTTAGRQLVEIARALYRQARVLVLDEPTAALSRREASLLFQVMAGLRERGIGLIYISHHLEEVFAVADRITVLRDGRNVATWQRGTVSEPELVQAMVGEVVASSEHRPAARPGSALLTVQDWTGTGFASISLTLHRGEIVALVGAAGAGQVEFCRSLIGAELVQRGELRLEGKPVRIPSPSAAAAQGILYSPGDRKSLGILPNLGVAANLTFPRLDRWTRCGVLQPAAVRAAARAEIERYGIRCTGPDQEMRSLSGGNQQKVVAARAAERQGRVYLFDEPTRGVDVASRAEIYTTMERLARPGAGPGAGILVATPDLQEALRIGDRIGVLRQGKLVALEAREETSEERLLGHLLGAERTGPGTPEALR